MASRRVLVVDDEILLANLVADALVEAGFEVVVAATQEDAIDQLDRLDGQLVALVTDIRIGAGSGWTVASHARASNTALPVVYMTGDSAKAWHTLGVPDSILVEKPFAATQILAAVIRVTTQMSGRDAETRQRL